jgi:outer membrane protein TolC
MIIFLILLFFISSYANAETLSLKELSKILLSENPRIQSMEREVKMRELKISSSSSLEDPKFKIGLNNIPVDTWSFRDEDMTSKEIGISQMIPLGGKLKVKESIAYKEFLIAKENLRKEKINMLLELEKNYYELAYVRNSIKILENMKNYLKLLIESESAFVKSGMGSISNVIKINLEEKMIDEEIIGLKQKEKEYLKNISYLVGRDVDSISSDRLFWVEVESNREFLKDKLLANNPDIKIIELEGQLSNEEINLRQKEYIPDLELSVSYMQRDSFKDGTKRPDMISAMAVFNIPLWYKSKNKPMVEEMKKKKEMMNKRLEDKKNELISKIEIQVGEIEKINALKFLYENSLIPQNELILETYLARYKTSNLEFMPIIDSIRNLLKYKRELESLKRDLSIVKSNIDALIGGYELGEN